MRYATAGAFRSALEAQVRRQSTLGGPSIVRLRKAIAFERLLARLLAVAPERWMLKGALALDFRLSMQARATMDMDLGWNDTADAVTRDLLAAAAYDLGDYFVFAVERTDRLDALRDASAVRYHVEAELAGRTFEKVLVDVGISWLPSAQGDQQTDTISGPDFLQFSGIAPIAIPMLALEYHVAEKVHAYTRGYGEAGSVQSTRVKDLVDLALIASHSTFPAHRLRAALDEVFARRRLHSLPASLPPPPASWGKPYATMSRDVGIAGDVTLGHTHAAAFLDPILSSSALLHAWWNPAAQQWRSVDDEE